MGERDEEWEDEELIAARALVAFMEVEGDDELAQVHREALALVAQEAVALKERREARERQEERARRRVEARAVREELARRKAEQRQREAAEERARLAREARARREALRRQRAEEARRLREERKARPIARPARRSASPACVAVEEAHGDGHQATDRATGRVPAAAEEPVVPALLKVVPSDDLPALTGADLAEWRAGLGLTQQAAADRLGVRQGTISKAEGRRDKVLGESVRRALTRAIGA